VNIHHALPQPARWCQWNSPYGNLHYKSAVTETSELFAHHQRTCFDTLTFPLVYRLYGLFKDDVPVADFMYEQMQNGSFIN